jgi:hypothetical protein
MKGTVEMCAVAAFERTLSLQSMLSRLCVLCEVHLHQHVDGSFACHASCVLFKAHDLFPP